MGATGRRVSKRPSQNRVIHADWLEAVRRLPPSSVDMLYADLPFNTGRERSGRAGAYNDRWDSPASYINWLRQRLASTIPCLKTSACVLLHVDFRVCHHVRLLLDEMLDPSRFVNHLIWHYGLGGSSPRRFARKHDDILFYCLDPGKYWFVPPQVPARSVRLRGRQKKATDVLRVAADEVLDIANINNMARERTGYPTQKPLALLEMLVNACCPPGGVVLDPTCGSGTTLVAAARCGRRAVGIDESAAAVRLARRRLAEV